MFGRASCEEPRSDGRLTRRVESATRTTAMSTQRRTRSITTAKHSSRQKASAAQLALQKSSDGVCHAPFPRQQGRALAHPGCPSGPASPCHTRCLPIFGSRNEGLLKSPRPSPKLRHDLGCEHGGVRQSSLHPTRVSFARASGRASAGMSVYAHLARGPHDVHSVVTETDSGCVCVNPSSAT